MEQQIRGFTVQHAMDWIAKYSLGMMLIMGTATFVSVAIFKIDYYDYLFQTRWKSFWMAEAMSGVVAVTSEALRLSLLVASARDFSLGRKIIGWLGLLGSIGLTIYDWNVAMSVAEIWKDTYPGILNTIRFLVVAGLGIEVRLILMLFHREATKITEKPKKGKRESRKNGSMNGISIEEELKIPDLQ
jgi:hypothetical protein